MAGRVLITSALPYVNNEPHLGNIVGSVLSADVYARYCRSKGLDVLFVCGTDEYGTATEVKAKELGMTCRELCDTFHQVHKKVYEWFQCSFDVFGRTSSSSQATISQDIVRGLWNGGFLLERTTQQLWSEPLAMFLADRYVIGGCPGCGSGDARGDQCDACGSLLTPSELVEPRCAVTGATPSLRETTHLYLDLPALTPALTDYVRGCQHEWSHNCSAITKAWMDRGLCARSITRDLSWGTPVPVPGYESKVLYVWFDAPIGYISITAEAREDWESWWKDPRVELVQFMGKDNVPFHTIVFPATLLGTGQEWTMMGKASVTEYLRFEGNKFSKSRGIGVFGSDAMESGVKSDVWRYYLMSIRPETSDTSFSWADFASKVNADLNDNLGNFVHRTLTFIHNKGVPRPDVVANVLSAKVEELVCQYTAAMDGRRLKEALRAAISVSKLGNAYFQETRPWTDPVGTAGNVWECAGLVMVLGALLQPFMPGFATWVASHLGPLPSLSALQDVHPALSDIKPVPYFSKM